MNSLQIRLQTVKTILAKLEEGIIILNQKDDPHIATYYIQLQCSAIQYFKFAIDNFSKLINGYLNQKYTIGVPSSDLQATFHEALNVQIVQKHEMEIFQAMINDRNLISEPFEEEMAEEICKRLPAYYEVIHNILNRIKI